MPWSPIPILPMLVWNFGDGIVAEPVMKRVNPADVKASARLIHPSLPRNDHRSSLAHAADLPICILRLTDHGAIIETVNQAAYRTTGARPRELIGWDPHSFLPLRASRRFGACIRKCLRRGSCEVQTWINLPAGRQFWSLTLNALPSDFEGTEHILLIGERLLIDEAEFAAAETASILSNGLMSPDLVFTFDPVSVTFSRIGRTADPAHLTSGPSEPIDVLHPEDLAKLPERIARLARLPLGITMTWIFRADLGDGRGYRSYLSRSHVLKRNAAGAVTLVGGAALDITRHVAVERQTRALGDQLLAVQNEERRRFARELHDSTGQHLTALGLAVGHLRRVCGASPETAPILADMSQIIDEARREVRVLSYLLHPPQLETRGLSFSLRTFLAGFSQRSDIQVQLDLAPEVDAIPRRQARALFRIVQEALNNVHRHAHASLVEVTLGVGENIATVTVVDDGRGFDQRCGVQVGVGLAGMRARARAFGGDLVISSGPAGTVLRATVYLGQVASS